MNNNPPYAEITGILLLFLVFFFLPSIFMYFLVRFVSKGRSNRKYLKNKTLVPIYEPPKDLTAAELGTLFDRKGGRLELLGTLYDLKNRKIIFIDNSSKEMVKIKILKYDGVKLKKYEDLLLRYFFNKSKVINLKDYLQGILFSTTQGYFNFLVLQGLQDSGYLKPTSEYSGKTYHEFLSSYFDSGKNNPLFVISKLFKYFFGGYESDLTVEAKDSLPELEGFKHYIETAEIDKIKFHATGDLNQYIEKLTPYAIALNQLERWEVIDIPLFVKIEQGVMLKGTDSMESDYESYMKAQLKAVEDIDALQVAK